MAGDREGSIIGVPLEFRRLPEGYRSMPTDALRGRRLTREKLQAYKHTEGTVVGSLMKGCIKEEGSWPKLPEWTLYKGKLYHLEEVDAAGTAIYYEEPDFEDMGAQPGSL